VDHKTKPADLQALHAVWERQSQLKLLVFVYAMPPDPVAVTISVQRYRRSSMRQVTVTGEGKFRRSLELSHKRNDDTMTPNLRPSAPPGV
jgi:hypothetical protein